VDLAVVDGLDPRGEQPVELAQVGDPMAAGIVGVAGDLDQELFAHGPEVAFDLPAALRAAWHGVDQPNPEARAGPQQPRVDERGTVVDIDSVGDPARPERRTQRGGQADGVLGKPEPVPMIAREWSSRRPGRSCTGAADSAEGDPSTGPKGNDGRGDLIGRPVRAVRKLNQPGATPTRPPDP
jgi:hypothetical protein